MLHWWRSVSTRGRQWIAGALLLTGGVALCVGIVLLNHASQTRVGAGTGSVSASVVPPTTRTAQPIPTVGTEQSGPPGTVTITEPASTVEVLVEHTSGSGSDTTVAVALIGAGAVIIAAAIAATSAVLVARVSSPAHGTRDGDRSRRRAPRQR